MTTFFLAIDTYNRYQRDFFGFPQKDKPTEKRPVTLTIFNNLGEKYSAQFKSERLSDDSAWHGAIIHPADYGQKKSDSRIAQESYNWMCKQTASNPVIVTIDKLTQQVIENIYNTNIHITGHGLRYQFLPNWMKDGFMTLEDFVFNCSNQIKHEIFEKMWMEKVPGYSETKLAFTQAQRMVMIQEHKTYPIFHQSHLSGETAHKLFEVYQLIQRLKGTQ